jgi:hypothetical protein
MEEIVSVQIGEGVSRAMCGEGTLCLARFVIVPPFTQDVVVKRLMFTRFQELFSRLEFLLKFKFGLLEELSIVFPISLDLIKVIFYKVLRPSVHSISQAER